MSAQGWLHANLVRLHKAVLCANCEVISEGLNGHCAACGSEALLSLNRLLGGAIEAEVSFALSGHLPSATNAHPSGFSAAA
jgi:hypothetical protein